MRNICFVILIKSLLVASLPANSQSPDVYNSKSAFSVFVKKVKNNNSEMLQVEVFKNGTPFPIKFLGNIDVSGSKKTRNLIGCLQNGQSTYSRMVLKFQGNPVGWLLKRGLTCSGQPVYRHRIIAIQPKLEGSYEWEIDSPYPIQIKESAEGLDFWMTERITRNGDGEKQNHLYIPSKKRLKIEWTRGFELQESRLPDNPSEWIPIEKVENNFQTFFMVGLREFNFRLMNFAIENYFSSSDRSIYEKWGLPTKESNAKKLTESLEQISNQSDALTTRRF
jgi:hypothetical protein